MRFLCKYCIRYSRLSEIRAISQNASPILHLNKLYSGSHQCKKHFSGTTVRWKDDEVPSPLSKYEKFSEESAPIILDVEEERQKVTAEDEIEEFEGINLKRGVTGVFDITELVDLLRKEKAENIFVVKIPPKYSYGDYMVIVNGRSLKHMLAISTFIRRLYKKKMNVSDVIPKLEGEDSKNWMAIDLGNIILHVFSKEGREIYDLETLWSVGKEYDSHSQLHSSLAEDLSVDFAKILASLSPKS